MPEISSTTAWASCSDWRLQVPTPVMAPASMTGEESHGELPWPDFQKAHLRLCTQEFYIAQCWNLDRQLGTEERTMLHAFQQQVFHMVNMSLLDNSV